MLIDDVIAAIEATGGLPSSRMLTTDDDDDPPPAPLDPDLVDRLTLEDGAPLPPSLRRWLAFDGAWQPLAIDAEAGVIRGRSFRDLLPPELAEHLGVLEEKLLPGRCYPVHTPSLCGDGAVLFLYAGDAVADPAGELPVVGLDLSDDGLVGVFASDFAVYMARVTDVVEPIGHAFGAGPPPYEAAGRAALARLRAQAPDADARRSTDDVIFVGGLLF